MKRKQNVKWRKNPCKNLMFMITVTKHHLKSIHEYFPDDKFLDVIKILEELEKDGKDDDNNSGQ